MDIQKEIFIEINRLLLTGLERKLQAHFSSDTREQLVYRFYYTPYIH